MAWPRPRPPLKQRLVEGQIPRLGCGERLGPALRCERQQQEQREKQKQKQQQQQQTRHDEDDKRKQQRTNAQQSTMKHHQKSRGHNVNNKTANGSPTNTNSCCEVSFTSEKGTGLSSPQTVFGPDTLITHRLANPIPYLNLEVPQHVLDVLKSNGASPSTSNRSDAARDCRFGAEPLTLKCQLNLISLATRKSRPTFESQSRAPRSPLTSPTLSQPLTFHTAPTQREEKRP